MIYNALMQSKINYGILAWGYKAERILKLQKKAVRYLESSPKQNAMHTQNLFSKSCPYYKYMIYSQFVN